MTATVEAITSEQVVEAFEDAAQQAADAQIVPAPSASGGYLALRPGQERLDENQRAALAGLGIDPDDRSAWPHIALFVHSCQAAGLDPWRKQAYLIKRGQGEYAKFTHQTGIEGFRLMGQRTGRFRRRLPLGWIGPDEDPRSWRYDADDDIDKPRWQSVWIGDEPPFAARCVIEHYADDGTLVRTEAVARWKDYAPYLPVWVGPKSSRVRKKNPDGSDVLELSEMWAKMGPQQLAKCAEAAAYRAAFAREIGGFYTPEEMQQADAEDIAAGNEERAARRRAGRNAARTGNAAQSEVIESVAVDADVVNEQPVESVDGVDPATGRLVDPDPQPELTTEELPGRASRAEMIAELTARAQLYGRDVEAYLSRTLKAIADERRATDPEGTWVVTIDDVPDDALEIKLRDGQVYTATKLRELGRHQDAEHVAGGGWLTDAAEIAGGA